MPRVHSFTTLDGMELPTPVAVVEPKGSNTPTAPTPTPTGMRTGSDHKKATTKFAVDEIVLSQHKFDKSIIRNQLQVVGCSHCDIVLSMRDVMRLFAEFCELRPER